jgi:hypothetical protein
MEHTLAVRIYSEKTASRPRLVFVAAQIGIRCSSTTANLSSDYAARMPVRGCISWKRRNHLYFLSWKHLPGLLGIGFTSDRQKM